MTQWGLDTLFNPAKRHMDDEKRRLQSTREEVGDSSGGKRIDLESGKVVIHVDDETDTETAELEAAELEAAEPGAAEPGAVENAGVAKAAKTKAARPAKDTAKETPAQARARARQAAAKKKA
jgi:hypothetical protein